MIGENRAHHAFIKSLSVGVRVSEVVHPASNVCLHRGAYALTASSTL